MSMRSVIWYGRATGVCIAILVWLTSAQLASGTTYTSAIANGNWGDSTAWSPNGVPGAGDDAIIASGVNMYLRTLGGVPGSFSCSNLILNDDLNGVSSTLTITAGGQITQNTGGSITAGTSTIVFTNGGAVTSNSGTITMNSLTINGSVTFIPVSHNAFAVEAAGTFTNNGTIRTVQTVFGNSFYLFGVGTTSSNNSWARLDVTNTGGLTSLDVSIVDSNHPNAGTNNATGRYWSITPTGGGYTVGITVPDNVADPYLTRWNGASWDTPARTADNTGTVTLSGITALSDWTVNDGVTVPVELSTFNVK